MFKVLNKKSKKEPEEIEGNLSGLQFRSIILSKASCAQSTDFRQVIGIWGATTDFLLGGGT